ncbi:MAG TPA: ABC transporter ATP-binding protein [Bacillota bacterium]|nr:ABC transporter ATP-binding protein [Bacillota bacterium]HPZ42306.1 ABC transporter ATP-binding protein [Bacillota bacterium]
MLKRFVKYYRPHLPLFILDFSCAFAIAGLDLVFPVAVQWIIDQIFPQHDLALLARICAGLLGLYLLRALLQYIVDYWGHVLGVRMEYDMRQDLFDHIQKLSFRYFDKTKTGHIMSRLVNDLNEISELAHHGPEDLFIATVTLTGAFIIMMMLNWKLALLVFLPIPAMIWFAVSKNKEMQTTFRNVRLKVADINARVEDSISGVRVVKSFTNEWYEKEKFERDNLNFRRSKQRSFRVMAQFFSGINLFSNLISLIVLFFGGYFIYRGELTLGVLVGFLLYVNMFLQPIRRISVLVETYQRGMAGFHRFVETLQIEPEIIDHKEARPAGRLKGAIVFDNVTFSYNRDKNILEDISLRIAPGETVALVGPSGAGKTTLCNLIPRFYDVQKGSIKIDGIDIRDFTQRSLRQNIGIVQQDVFLFTGTIRENIAYGKIETTDEEIVAAAKQANAHDFIMELEKGYDTYTGERGVMLSGGQRQRIAIARIFLKNPPILILDEATSALDSETEAMIQEALSELSRDRSTLVIAHRLATVRRAHRIIVLTDDGIVEEGTHAQLLKKNGYYARLYRAQFDGFIPDIA